MAEYLSNLGIILIFYISLGALYTVWGKNQWFCPSFPSCWTPLVLTDTSQSQRADPLMGSPPLHAWSQQLVAMTEIHPSLRLPFCQHFAGLFFYVGVFYSALPLFKSTVAPGHFLGIGMKERFRVFKGTSHTHTVVLDGWHPEDRVCGCKCV